VLGEKDRTEAMKIGSWIIRGFGADNTKSMTRVSAATMSREGSLQANKSSEKSLVSSLKNERKARLNSRKENRV